MDDRTTEKQKQEHMGFSYETLEQAFQKEAGSLLSEEIIQKTLNEEKKKFLRAEEMGIPTFSFTGKNIQRYTKGLLRQNQPFPFLYESLGFLMEFFLLLFFYLIVLGTIKTTLGQEGDFLHTKQECLYASVILLVLLLFPRIKEKKIGVYFLQCTRQMNKRPWEKELLYLSAISAAELFFPCAICIVLMWKFHLSQSVLLDPITAFLIYVCMALLSGIHNVIYSSFFISYYTIGGWILMRKPEQEIEQAVVQYKMLCYERMLGSLGKKMNDFLQDERLAKNLMAQLRRKLATYRGYAFFGMLLFLVLVIICVVQMILLSFQISIGFFVFTLLSAFGFLLLLIAFLSSSRVIKTLPKK